MITRTVALHGELAKLREEIHKYALDYGLDFYPVVFEICDHDTINILAAQGGFPHRYPHWRFGMEYDQLSKSHTYGLSKIYEMVINTDPCYAYLLKANHLVDQKIVMAHVYGHADFFKNNAWFKNTDRKMMDVMANHRTKIRRYMDLHGQDTVEEFIDRVHSLENLLDTNILFETLELRYSRMRKERQYKKQRSGKNSPQDFPQDERSEYLKSFMRSQTSSQNSSKKKSSKDDKTKDFQAPKNSSPRDIMMFLIESAPLEEWEADVLGCLREEAYYFLPQRMTKIMNEGWASYWHSTIMTQKALGPSEIIDFSDKHAGVMAMSRRQINPYKIGIELFRDIKYRWDTGRFGKDYQECKSMPDRENWNLKTERGNEKIFEIRKTHNDITFIDEFFTQDFCLRQQLFTYEYNSRIGRFVINERDFEAVKSKLLASLTNFGNPVIEVESGNFKNRGELHLIHKHQGIDLDMALAADTLKSIYYLWKRPVNLSTIQDRQKVTLCFDGQEMRTIKN